MSILYSFRYFFSEKTYCFSIFNISHFKEGFYIIKFFGNLDELICIKKVIKSNKK